MTTVTGSLAAVNTVPTTGTLTVRSLTMRPTGQYVVTGEPKLAPITDGKFSIELYAGPCQFTVAGDGVSHDITVTVPDEPAVVDFVDLLEDAYPWEPEVVSAARQAAREAAESARKAEAAQKVIGSAERVLEAESNAAKSATDSARSATASSDSAAESERQAGVSEGHANAAMTARQQSGTARDAAQKAQKAAEDAQAESEKQALASAESAEKSDKNQKNAYNYQETSWKGRTDSLNAAKEAEQSKAEAAQQASNAASSASDAHDAATNAATDVKKELSGLAKQATTAAGAAKTSASDAKGSEDKARQYAEAAGEAVASGSPDATDTTKGKVKLSGDLGGTADAPTVPGLADKADKSHTHTMDQVTGLDALKSKVDKATYQATSGTLVERGADGTASFAIPTGSNHAATKGYVDESVKAKTVTSEQVSDATSATGSEAAANKVVKTGTDGYVHVNGAPSADTHATPKSYVDSRIVVVASEDEVGTEDGVLYVVAE